MGLGFTFALTLIGAIREILGNGTLFADASLLFGPAFHAMELRILPSDMSGMLMMILPPGGFLVAGFVVVGKRILDLRAGKGIQMAGAHSV